MSVIDNIFPSVNNDMNMQSGLQKDLLKLLQKAKNTSETKEAKVSQITHIEKL